MTTPDISVIVSTHNRCDSLAATLESLIVASGFSRKTTTEILIVDNGSDDDTHRVIHDFVLRHAHVRHLFEARRGVSYGRNTALQLASAPIIVFTDDDVIVEPTWLVNIARAFESHPEVDYVSGRILPLWESPPPAWVALRNNGPLALRDGGDEPLFGRPGRFFAGWATANLAFRRRVLDRIGLFNPEFPRGQDLELMMRVWRAGFAGMYAPVVVVHHHVPSARMTRAYHRAWHRRQGELRARLHFREVFDADDAIVDEAPIARTVLGVAPHLHRALAASFGRWMAAAIKGDRITAFVEECGVHQIVSYIQARRIGSGATPQPEEVAASVAAQG